MKKEITLLKDIESNSQEAWLPERLIVYLPRINN